MERLYLCRGSRNLEQHLTDTADKSLADSGTRIHNALAGTLEADLLTEDERWVFTRCQEHERELVESVFGTLDWENLKDGKLPMESGGFLEVWREKREWLFSEEDEKQASGELDVVYFDRSQLKALVIDYKSGYKPVTEPDQNIQLRTYASLTHERYGAVIVIVAVIQPRCMPQTARALYAEEDLVYAGKELRVVLEEALDPDAKRVPGPAQCEYCKAKGICKELRKQLKQDRPDVVEINLISGKELDLREQMMPGYRLSEILDKVGHYERACKAIREEAKLRIKHGREVPGYALVPGRQQRKIVHVYGLFEKIVHKLGWMSPKDFWNHFVSISVTDLDKLAKKHPPKSLTVTPQRLFTKRFGEFIEVKSTDLVLERTSYLKANSYQPTADKTKEIFEQREQPLLPMPESRNEKLSQLFGGKTNERRSAGKK